MFFSIGEYNFMTLKDFFSTYKNVALAYSGGVDSSYLLYEACKHCETVTAYYVKSQFQPEFEFQDAIRLAKSFHASLKIIEVDTLSNSVIKANPADRCYHCKNTIFYNIIEHAKKDGFDTIIDGTNASDSQEDRPGMRALSELKVLSPLRLCNLTKQDVRQLSRLANLFTWNKYSYSCLATRVETNSEISNELLTKIEFCETLLKAFGFTDFRIRSKGDTALLQITKEDMQLFVDSQNKITVELKQHFKNIHLDLEFRIREEI